MKPRITTPIIAIAALSAATVALAAPEQIPRSYLPLEVGNRWTYVLTDGNVGPQNSARPRQEVRVTNMSRVAGQDVLRVENYLFRFAPADIAFYNDGRGNTVEMRVPATQDGIPKSGLWYPWSEPDRVKLPEFVLDCVHGSAGVFMPTDGNITVPAGTFDDVLKIVYDEHPCVDSGVLSETFARGVGLIERRIITFAGEETWSLERAELASPEPMGAPGAPAPEELSWGAIKSTFAR